MKSDVGVVWESDGERGDTGADRSGEQPIGAAR